MEKSRLVRTTEERDVRTTVRAMPSAMLSKPFLMTSIRMGSMFLLIVLLRVRVCYNGLPLLPTQVKL